MSPSDDSALGVYAFVVPILLLVLMICMGMELTREDFTRVVARPRAAMVGLFGQLLLLPCLGLGFALFAGFPPTIAFGIVLISACPGGSTSNIFSYLGRANLALSVTLTAISSMLCFVTIPLWIRIALGLFGDGLENDAQALQVPLVATALQLFFVTLLPVAIGMAIRGVWPAWSSRVREPVRRGAAVVMGAAIVLIVGGEWETVLEHFRDAALGALLLASATLLSGWTLARICQLDTRDAFTVSIEVGIQNGALATMLAVSVLGRPDLVVFPGTYAVLSLVPVGLWTVSIRRRFTNS